MQIKDELRATRDPHRNRMDLSRIYTVMVGHRPDTVRTVNIRSVYGGLLIKKAVAVPPGANLTTCQVDMSSRPVAPMRPNGWLPFCDLVTLFLSFFLCSIFRQPSEVGQGGPPSHQKGLIAAMHYGILVP
jgi:hypothetical protein